MFELKFPRYRNLLTIQDIIIVVFISDKDSNVFQDSLSLTCLTIPNELKQKTQWIINTLQKEPVKRRDTVILTFYFLKIRVKTNLFRFSTNLTTSSRRLESFIPQRPEKLSTKTLYFIKTSRLDLKQKKTMMVQKTDIKCYISITLYINENKLTKYHNIIRVHMNENVQIVVRVKPSN